MRAIWKGVIELGKLEVPVKLYSAIEDQTVRFRLLHEKDLQPVEQKMVHPRTDEVVEWDEMRRGFEAGAKMVLLSEEDLESVEPEPSRSIEAHQFLEKGVIDQRWYERPYFLGSDGDEAAYLGLKEALIETGLEGVLGWTMRNKRYVGALIAEEEGLVLITLRDRREVVRTEDLPKPSGREFSQKEKEMARLLVDSLSSELDMSEWESSWRRRVMELIDAKKEGRAPKLKKFRRKRKTDDDLAESLEASIAALKKGA